MLSISKHFLTFAFILLPFFHLCSIYRYVLYITILPLLLLSILKDAFTIHIFVFPCYTSDFILVNFVNSFPFPKSSKLFTASLCVCIYIYILLLPFVGS